MDIGGGNGAFLGGLLARFTDLRGTVFDRPDVGERAVEHVREIGVAYRCGVEGGDFFDRLPAGADAYVLKRILYGWHDPEALSLLRAVSEAMRPDSRLLIIEPLVDPNGGTEISRRFADCGEMSRQYAH